MSVEDDGDLQDTDHRVRGRRVRIASHFCIGLAVTIGVVAPLTERGWLLLLDWAPGPHVPMSRALWGLEGGLIAGSPFSVVLSFASAILPEGTGGWLPLAAALLIGWCGAGHLVGGSLVRRIGASGVYIVNPVVYERLAAGQIGYLLAYALLPGFASALFRRPGWVGGARCVALLGLTVAASPHFIWLAAVLFVVLLAVDRRPRTAGRVGMICLGGALVNVYVVGISSLSAAPVRIGEGDLSLFRTSSDPFLGLFGNVIGLYGFWRQGIALPKDDLPGWPFVLAALLVVCGVGIRAGRRSGSATLSVVVIAGLVGGLLAMGGDGPLASLYRFAFHRVPGFVLMREPQKFIALLALAYATSFGYGAEHLVAQVKARRRAVAAAVVIVMLPVMYSPTLFWGLAGRVQASSVPSSWSDADVLMGDGEGHVLFLPWHLYLSFPFTQGVVLNPADAFFRRVTISGDNLELPGRPSSSVSARSTYLEDLFARGADICAFGDLVAPLGVEYVVLAKTVDWQGFGWLARQVDLEVVLENDDLIVYRNRRFRGAVWRARLEPPTSGPAAGHGLSVVARRQPTGGTDDSLPSACRAPEDDGDVPPRGRRLSPTAYAAPAGDGVIVVPEPYDPGWRAADGSAGATLALVGGVTGVVAADATTVKFQPWDEARWWYGASGATALFVGSLSLGEGFRSRRRGRLRPGTEDAGRP